MTGRASLEAGERYVLALRVSPADDAVVQGLSPMSDTTTPFE